MTTIKYAVFDCGNVLVPYDVSRFCEKIANHSVYSAEKIRGLIFGAPAKLGYSQAKLGEGSLHRQYEAGELTTDEFFQAVVRETGVKDVSFEMFKHYWNFIFLEENEDIKPIIKKIKPEIKKLILSNNNEIHWAYTSQLLIIKDNFSTNGKIDALLSFQLKMFKPGEKIFLKLIEACACRPDEIFFIDDTLENSQAAAKLGIISLNYNCQIHPIEKLKSEMEKYNLFI